jgi:hypothetical protein
MVLRAGVNQRGFLLLLLFYRHHINGDLLENEDPPT